MTATAVTLKVKRKENRVNAKFSLGRIEAKKNRTAVRFFFASGKLFAFAVQCVLSAEFTVLF